MRQSARIDANPAMLLRSGGMARPLVSELLHQRALVPATKQKV